MPHSPAMRLLLLEDSPAEYENLLVWLRPHFQIDHVTSVAGVRKLLAGNRYDVGLIDLCVDDSRDLATFLTVRELAPELPVVVQSGLQEDAIALEAVARGAQDYLVKRSFTAELVRRALRYAMERAGAERELRESRERYQLALAGARDGIWDWNVLTGTFVVSERWCAMLGLAPGEFGLEVEDWLLLMHPAERDAVWSTLQEHLAGATPHFEIEHRMHHAAEGWVWVRSRGMAVHDAAGRVTRVAGSQSDVTERRAVEAELVRRATTDDLTGLANRAAFLARLQEASDRLDGNPRGAFGLLFLDLDRFKVINDSLGHQVGDRLLIAVAQRLSLGVRPGDLVARLGGDEFAILAEPVDGPRAAEELAARLHRTLAQPFVLGDNQVFASVSIGIVACESKGGDAEELLRNADIAMYRSKRAGRAGTELFAQAHHAAVAGRLDLETGLRRALAEGGLSLKYQPIVGLPGAELVGFEALVRWTQPDGRSVDPSVFIPLAEETGLIVELGAWVMQEACARMAMLSRMHDGASDLAISVNVSSRQFAHGDMYELVRRVLTETGLPASRLVLELTETALMENPVTVADVLTRLRAHGVRVHLDDFGIGYSSLSYLQRFPIDSLKIDRSFTQGVPGQSGDEAIVRAILSLASALGMEVVAEGVESAAQLAHLAGLRCGFGQGYLFSRPVESRALDGLLGRDFRPKALPPALERPLAFGHRRRAGERVAQG